MSTFGIEAWDAQGKPILSITDRLTRVLGEVPYDGSMNGSTGTITVTAPGTIFAYACLTKNMIDLTDTQQGVQFRILRIDQTARTIKYEKINAPIIYGVY